MHQPHYMYELIYYKWDLFFKKLNFHYELLCKVSMVDDPYFIHHPHTETVWVPPEPLGALSNLTHYLPMFQIWTWNIIMDKAGS